MSEQVKQCYKIEEDSEAVKCIKDVVRNSQGESCHPRLVLLVKEGCGGCAESKEHYKDDIASGLVKVLDIRTKEGMEIANKNKIDAVPAFLVVDCNDIAIE